MRKINIKQKAILLLQERKDRSSKFILKNIDTLSAEDITDLLVLLTSEDKGILQKIATKKIRTVEKCLKQLEQLEHKSQKLILGFRETQEQRRDTKTENDLLSQLSSL